MTETRLRSESPEAEIEAEQFTARWEAAALEGGGEVINEYYSREEYVKRRAHFLGQHPEWRHHKNGLFEAARGTAQEVFAYDDEQLSVQEVQRREIACGVVPLLPLPTTANTQTLDGFHGYPRTEWTPAPETSLDGTALSKTRLANTTKTSRPSKQTAPRYISAVPARGEESTISFSSSRNIMSNEQSTTAGGSLSSMNSEVAPHPGSQASPSEAEKVNQILAQLGRPGWQSEHYTSEKMDSPHAHTSGEHEASKEVMVGRGVSALANRGMSVPVKSRTKRAGTPTYAADETSEPDDIADQDAPAQKKRKSDRSSGESGHAAAAPKERATSSEPQTVAGSQSDSGLLEGVVLGTELPRTKKDAIAAAGIRYDRLLAEHTAGVRVSKRKTTSTAQKPNPDFRPEFFKTENFKKGQEKDSVRCVCGVCIDDHELMVACKKCEVWQHTACVGFKKGAKRYLCHVCDPWAHRELIAQMRLDRPLKG